MALNTSSHPPSSIHIACLSEKLCLLPSCLNPKSERSRLHLPHPLQFICPRLPLTAGSQGFLEVPLLSSILVATYPTSVLHRPPPGLLHLCSCLLPASIACSCSFLPQFILRDARTRSMLLPEIFHQLSPLL